MFNFISLNAKHTAYSQIKWNFLVKQMFSIRSHFHTISQIRYAICNILSNRISILFIPNYIKITSIAYFQ